MSCYCHIAPPCSYCLEQVECAVCGELKQREDTDGGIDPVCFDCMDASLGPEDR